MNGNENNFILLRQRGSNFVAVFPLNVHTRSINPELLKDLKGAGFEVSANGVHYRKMEMKGENVGYEILTNNNPPEVTQARSGADYFNECMRTLQIQSKEIISDLYKLNKLLFKQYIYAQPNVIMK